MSSRVFDRNAAKVGLPVRSVCSKTVIHEHAEESLGFFHGTVGHPGSDQDLFLLGMT